MNFFLVVGIVILGTFLITNVHSGGIRNRKLKPSKPNSNIYVSKDQLTYPGVPGTSSVSGYPYPDPNYSPETDNDGCCGCGKKNPPKLYPYNPTAPVGNLPPTGPIGNLPPTGTVGNPPSGASGSTGSSIVGFAEGTTGGQGGVTVQINNLADFLQYVQDNTTRVLLINSDITSPNQLWVTLGPNKSILGSSGNATLYNIYLRTVPTSQNIIFQNLIFKHSVGNKDNSAIQLYLNAGTGYWIDHCSFPGHEWSADDGSLDKLLYIGEQASGATISNCFFGNHKYGQIFGHPNDNLDAAGTDDTRVTIFNNRFENLDDRAPGLFRFGQYHVFNNYINNYGLGFTVATKGEVISEYNYFGTCTTNNGMLDDKGSGEFMDTGSVPSILNVVSPRPDWSPSYHYNLQVSDPRTLNTVSKNVKKIIVPSKFPAPLPPILFPPTVQIMPPPHFPGLH